MATDANHAFLVAMSELGRAMKRRFVAMAAEYDLTLPQWRVLGQLALRDGVTQRALADLTDTDPMTLGQIVERLEVKGLVRREADPSDGRAKIVRLAEGADETSLAMKTVAERVYAEAMTGFDPDERATFLNLLQRAGANLAASAEEN